MAVSGAPAVRLGVDGRELRPGVRTGIRRYVFEILRAVSQDGWPCVVYGDAGARLDQTLPGVTFTALDASWTQWWDQVTLPRALARDRITVFLSPYYKGPVDQAVAVGDAYVPERGARCQLAGDPRVRHRARAVGMDQRRVGGPSEPDERIHAPDAAGPGPAQ